MPLSPLYKFPSLRKDPKLPSVKDLHSRLNSLPDELLLMIMSTLPNADVLSMRTVNKHMGRVSQEVIRERTKKRLQSLSIESNTIENSYNDLLLNRKPQLDHFKLFLNNLSVMNIQEASSYNVVPLELQIVFECIVCLKEGPLKSTNQYEKWIETKRRLGRYNFKNWFINLNSNVDSLDMNNIIHVRNIIIQNPLINYERIFSISSCGYNILIAIGACLQYGWISHEVSTKYSEMSASRQRLTNALQFLRLIS
jgi:hypothetical protein